MFDLATLKEIFFPTAQNPARAKIVKEQFASPSHLIKVREFIQNLESRGVKKIGVVDFLKLIEFFLQSEVSAIESLKRFLSPETDVYTLNVKEKRESLVSPFKTASPDPEYEVQIYRVQKKLPFYPLKQIFSLLDSQTKKSLFGADLNFEHKTDMEEALSQVAIYIKLLNQRDTGFDQPISYYPDTYLLPLLQAYKILFDEINDFDLFNEIKNLDCKEDHIAIKASLHSIARGPFPQNAIEVAKIIPLLISDTPSWVNMYKFGKIKNQVSPLFSIAQEFNFEEVKLYDTIRYKGLTVDQSIKILNKFFIESFISDNIKSLADDLERLKTFFDIVSSKGFKRLAGVPNTIEELKYLLELIEKRTDFMSFRAVIIEFSEGIKDPLILFKR